VRKNNQIGGYLGEAAVVRGDGEVEFCVYCLMPGNDDGAE
jgi:hypothetical protein